MSISVRSCIARLSLAALAAALALGSLPARAEAPLDRVEVTGSATRHDVLRTCPMLGAELNERLGKVVAQEQITGSYRVTFDLRAARAGNFSAARMPSSYRRALRHAIHGSGCQDAAALSSPQRFAFVLDVTMDDEAAPQRMAGVTKRVHFALRETL